MKIPEEFNEIRPYTPEELPKVFEELLSDNDFKKVIRKVLPDTPIETLAGILKDCKTTLDVQKNIFYGLLHDIIEKNSDGFSFDCSRIPRKDKGYTFISNHRDIVLDSSLLAVGLIDKGFPTTAEIAIGDNLLIYPWIKKIVRLNAFIVQRALSMRQMLESSERMSRYIHFVVTQKQGNVWIAQREGRAKDSNDRTQDSVLKMLAMGANADVIDSLKELNIVPLSLSYEYDPCDFLKAQEMQLKRDNEGFRKSQQDDLINMQTGIFGYKGRIHFQSGPCINNELEELTGIPKAEIFTKVSELIDKHIHRNYLMYPPNYIACDMLNGNKAMAENYTDSDKAKFEAYMEKKISLINIPNKDTDFLRHCILTMYANPAINHINAMKE